MIIKKYLLNHCVIKRDSKMETLRLIYWIPVRCIKIRLDQGFVHKSLFQMILLPYLIQKYSIIILPYNFSLVFITF